MEPFYLTAKEFALRGRLDFPKEESPSHALIYSSPATLSYNSPGANGYGVKRAGLAIPESVMLLVAPGCCGRNSTILSRVSGYSERMFYLLMDETDLVTGRHLKKIPQAVEEILDVPEERPKVVVICITCVDALLGTDLVRVCRKAEERTGVHVVPSYMYALMREGTKPPMTAIRQSVYSLLMPLPKNPHAVNLLGQFAPYDDDTEIYEMFRKVGLSKVREIGRMKTLEEYMEMGEANFNLVLNPESRYAADDLMQRLGMPYIEMNRFYDINKIQRQYALLGGALGVKFDDSAYYEEASRALSEFRERHPKLTFAIGQTVNANPFELAAALISYGYAVDRVFANASPADLPYINRIAENSADTRFYTSISPTMMNYKLGGTVDITIGKDAAWYYPEAVNVPFFSDVQPFGYRGLMRLLKEIELAYREAQVKSGTRTEMESRAHREAQVKSGTRTLLAHEMQPRTEMESRAHREAQVKKGTHALLTREMQPRTEMEEAL